MLHIMQEFFRSCVLLGQLLQFLQDSCQIFIITEWIVVKSAGFVYPGLV